MIVNSPITCRLLTLAFILTLLFVVEARFNDCTTLSNECCWRPSNFSVPWQRHESIDQMWYRKNFRIGMLRPPPNQPYYSTVISEPNEISVLESCSYCSRSGNVKIYLRHWASATTSMELCWSQLTGQRNVTDCRELDTNKHGMIETQQISIQRNIPVFFSLILKSNSTSSPATGLVDFLNVRSELCSLNIQRLKSQRFVSLGGSHLATGRNPGSNSDEQNGRNLKEESEAASKFFNSEENEQSPISNVLDLMPATQLDEQVVQKNMPDSHSLSPSWSQLQAPTPTAQTSWPPKAAEPRPPSISPADVFDWPPTSVHHIVNKQQPQQSNLAARLQASIDEFNRQAALPSAFASSVNPSPPSFEATEFRTTDFRAPPPTAETQDDIQSPMKSKLFNSQQRSEFVARDKPTAPLSFAKMFEFLATTSASPLVSTWPSPTQNLGPFLVASPSAPTLWSSAASTSESNDQPPSHAHFSLPSTVDLAPVEFASLIPHNPPQPASESAPAPWLVAPQQFGTQINKRPPPVISLVTPKPFNPFADLFGDEFAEFLNPEFNTTKYDELEIRYEKSKHSAATTNLQTVPLKSKSTNRLPTHGPRNELQIGRLPNGATPRAVAPASLPLTTTTVRMPIDRLDANQIRQSVALNPLKLRPANRKFEGFASMEERYRAFTPTNTTMTSTTTTTSTTSIPPVTNATTDSSTLSDPPALPTPRSRWSAIEPIVAIRSHASTPVDNVDYPKIGHLPGRKSEQEDQERAVERSFKTKKNSKACFYSGGCLFEKSSCGFENSPSLATKGEFRRVTVGSSKFVEARVSPGEVAVYESPVNTTRGFYVLFDYLEWTEGEKLSACCFTPGRDPVDSYCPYESSTNETDVIWENGQIFCESETTKIMFICENFGNRGGVCAVDNIRIHAEWDTEFQQPCQANQLPNL
ncbi:hypothetical protein M3Y96_00994500 [Aphelenchoides besseyi]|nr:hypothetical protein M3Y96_00994500 [Aphelenchoides besseyi]